MRVLRLVLGVPAVLASTIMWVVALALLPPALGLLGFVTGVVVLVVLATGTGGLLAVRVLAGARSAAAGEQASIAPLAARLGVLEVAVGRHVLVRRSVGPRTPPAQLLGRGALVVTPWLIEATSRGWLTLEEAAAVVVHAEGRHQAERPRFELAMMALLLPWRTVGGVSRGIGRAVAWFPFVKFAWAIRGVVGAVAVVQQIDAGRTPLAVLAGTIVALTYLVPAAARAKEARVEEAADAAVIRLGLGAALVQAIHRYRLPLTQERLQRLVSHAEVLAAPDGDRPVLRLVRS